MSRIAVVGAGIAGLSAAFRLSSDPAHTVTVFEQTDRVGGKLRTETIAGHQVDVGAESVLARRPEAVELIRELGLPEVNPASVGAALWSRDELVPLPAGTFMGVPSNASTLRGVLSDAELARAGAEQVIRCTEDLSVGDLVERALGAAVVDRLVEPLLGGVYAGHARNLSAAACMRPLYDAARQGSSLTSVVASLTQPTAPGAEKPPVFASVRGGIGLLPAALHQRLVADGVRVRTGTTVHDLRHDGSGWTLSHGGMRDAQQETFDAVVVATPAAPAAKLLREIAPEAAQQLSQIEYASMVIVTFAFPRDRMPRLSGSGFLVPPVDGHAIKAATFSSAKWPWLAQSAPELVFVRVSLGRHGEAPTLQRPNRDLAGAGLADLAKALGAPLPEPVDIHLQRWGGGLPQYAVGHLDRVAAIADSLASRPTLQLAGAAYEGVGIPACIASGSRAADRLLDQFTHNNEERK